jgi:hypothetical protein
MTSDGSRVSAHGDDDALALATGQLVRVALEGTLGVKADQVSSSRRYGYPPRLVSCFICAEMSMDGLSADSES